MTTSKKKTHQKLIDRVIQKIKEDIDNGDETCINELLTFVDKKYLFGFLPEEEWQDYCEEGEAHRT